MWGRQLLDGIRAGGARQLVTAHPCAPVTYAYNVQSYLAALPRGSDFIGGEQGSSSSIMPADLDFFSVQNRAGRAGGGGTPAGTTGSLTRKDTIAYFPRARGAKGKTHKPVLMAETWYVIHID